MVNKTFLRVLSFKRCFKNNYDIIRGHYVMVERKTQESFSDFPSLLEVISQYPHNAHPIPTPQHSYLISSITLYIYTLSSSHTGLTIPQTLYIIFLHDLFPHLLIYSKFRSLVVQTPFCNPTSTTPQYSQTLCLTFFVFTQHLIPSNTVRKIIDYVHYCLFLLKM